MAFAGKREPKESFLTHQGPHLYGQCHGLIVRVWMNNDLQVEVSNCLGIFFVCFFAVVVCLFFCFFFHNTWFAGGWLDCSINCAFLILFLFLLLASLSLCKIDS